jgi:hypothetical protein
MIAETVRSVRTLKWYAVNVRSATTTRATAHTTQDVIRKR